MSHNPGRVVVCYGAESIVEDGAGHLYRCHHRRRQGQPLAGDRVEWRRTGDGTGVIESISLRHGVIERGDFRGRPRPTAANVDRMVVVVAPKPGVDRPLIDRYLVLAHYLEVEPLLWLNKADLLDGEALGATRRALAAYPSLGCPLLAGSAHGRYGLDELHDQLAGHVSILVGQSGVGKSSLVNALIPDLEVRIGALSAASGQGRHTTTATTLFHLPHGGDLIDSPGIRTLRLGHLSAPAVVAGFPEIAARARECRFADCRHRTEPGCAVRAALERREIDPARLANLRALLEEVSSTS